MNKRIKLFCLPYAGGSARSIYNSWREHLNPTIELIPVELAGRGSRIDEDLYIHPEEAINDVLDNIRDEIRSGDCDYAIFGHSMGSILAYKVIERINELELRTPIHAFFSGRRAPHCPSVRPKPYAKMNNLEIENEIKLLGGTPPEFFEYPELKKFFMPIFKSDFKTADMFVEESDLIAFDHDISVLIGKEEHVSTQEALEWKHVTNKNCYVEYFEGEHFFLLDPDQGKAVIDTINTCLVKKFEPVGVL